MGNQGKVREIFLTEIQLFSSLAEFGSLSLMFQKIIFLIKNQCIFTFVCCFSKRTIFNQKWLEEDEFKSWLVISNSDDKARCRLCKKDIELSNMGRRKLLSHYNGKKQIGNDMKVKSFF